MASELTLPELRKHCSTHLTQVYKNLYQAVVTTPNAFERPVWWREVGQKVEPESRQVAPPRAKLWVASTDCDFLLPNFWKLCTNIYCVKWILIYLFIIVVIKYIMLYSKLFTSWWKIRFLTFADCLLVPSRCHAQKICRETFQIATKPWNSQVFLKVSRYTLIKLGIGKGCLLQPWQECLRSVFLMQYQLVSMATSGDQRVKLTLKGTYFKFNSFVTVFPWHQYLKWNNDLQQMEITRAGAMLCGNWKLQKQVFWLKSSEKKYTKQKKVKVFIMYNVKV